MRQRIDLPGYDFAGVRFMSAEDKQRVLRDWERFLRLGMKFQNFSKALYHHLIQHCSFIAHYDRHGFYGTYFTAPEDTMRFLSQFDRNHANGLGAVEYGDTWWLNGDYADINGAMCDVATVYAPNYYGELEETAKNRDLALAESLFRKWGRPMEAG